MAKEGKEKAGEQPILDVEQALDKTERYIEENKKSIIIIIAAVIGMVGLYFGWKFFYLKPQEEAAQAEIYHAETYFGNDSFSLAISGKGDTLGFETLADEYGVTKSGNLSHYYLGISYLRTGKYEEAIEQLKEFDSDDQFLGAIAYGAIGDAYMELKKSDEAVNYYIKAAQKNSNKLTSPIFLKKAAMAYEDLGKKSEARKLYEQIKTEYSDSPEAQQIDKFIARTSEGKE